MTREQFGTAVELLQQDVWPDSRPDPVIQVFIAVCRIMKRQRGLSDDAGWDYFSPELRAQIGEFLASLDYGQRENLRLIAEKTLLVEKTAFH